MKIRAIAFLTLSVILTGCELLQPPPAAPRAPVRTSPVRFDPQALQKLAVVIEGLDYSTGASRQGGAYGSNVHYGTYNSYGSTGASRQDIAPSPMMLRQIEDEFILELLAQGYNVATRSDVTAILKEQSFQQSGLTEADAAKLGRMLNVPAVLLVRVVNCNVSSNPSSYLINGVPQVSYVANGGVSARLISVEKAEILWFATDAGSLSVSGPNEGEMILKSVATRIAKAFPPRQGQSSTSSSSSPSK